MGWGPVPAGFLEEAVLVQKPEDWKGREGCAEVDLGLDKSVWDEEPELRDGGTWDWDRVAWVNMPPWDLRESPWLSKHGCWKESTGLMDEGCHGPGVSEIQILPPLHNLMKLQGSIFKHLPGDGRILS